MQCPMDGLSEMLLSKVGTKGTKARLSQVPDVGISGDFKNDGAVVAQVTARSRMNHDVSDEVSGISFPLVR